jgi:hypothetical protein
MRFTLFIVSKKRFPDSEWFLYLSLALSCGALAVGVWGLLRTVPWHIHLGTTGAFKDVTGGIQSIITAGAVIVGGYWAYFKFIRNRTFMPRLEIGLEGQWRVVDSVDALHIRVQVRNIGASQVHLNQYGSGLRVSFPASGQSGDEIAWEPVPLVVEPDEAGPPPARVFELLTEASWVEPGEIVSDELLLNLHRAPGACMLEFQLTYGLSQQNNEYSDDDVRAFARRILSPDAALIDTVGSIGDAGSDTAEATNETSV